MIYVTSRMSVKLALIAVCVSPIFVFSTWFFSRSLQKRWETVKTVETTAFSVVQEVLGALRVVKAFRQENREIKKFFDHSLASIRERLGVIIGESAFSLSTGLTISLSSAAMRYFGVGEVRSGWLTVGDLILVMSYLGQLYDPLYSLGRQLAEQQGPLVGLRHCFDLLDQPNDVKERAGALRLERAQGAVTFRDVGFSYPGGRRVIDDVSFAIPAGSRVGIAGPTGSGKSTLMALLMRFYDPQQGQILLDGVDIRDVKLDDLPSQYAVVLQEPILFSTTFEENIANARPDASENEIIAAAQAANAHEFIMRLPDGYQAVVGERGMHLCGGERQRIALACAVLKNSPVLILDEPTSAVDSTTEDAIIAAVDRLMQGRTAFLIAHRLRTLQNCDLWLKIGRGQVEISRNPPWEKSPQLVPAGPSSAGPA
jgi:ATP-binding cassette subfamily B protein